MQNPWDVRPRQPAGDSDADTIFTAVGRALYAWETTESAVADLFDALVAAQPSNRAAYAAFIAVKASSARTELLEAATRRAAPSTDPARPLLDNIVNRLSKFGGRRNEIAHGVVYDFGLKGFYLGPNNVMPHKWGKDGEAKYEYVASDVAHYQREFESLKKSVEALTHALVQRDFASRADRRTASDMSRQNDRGIDT